MSTYYDKKKLIEDNSDVYISDYDKTLDYSYLSDIISQKRAYKKAQDAGDNEGMKNANDRANSIRLQAASYTAGEDGSQYNREKRPYEILKPQKTTSSYKKEKDNIYRKILSLGDFSYDAQSDPLFNSYKKIYLSLGDDAYERALNENALRTGGTLNTSAISAASLARNKYNTMLSNKIPELYDKAYDRYRDKLSDLYTRLKSVSDMEDTEYSHYRDDMNDYKDNRQYYYDKDKDIQDNLDDMYLDETDIKDTSDELTYKENKLASDTQNEKLKIAINLAKALYGKTPINQSVINTILSIIE